ncbi:MAG: type II secretion system major pseudopilin GspG [Candidatus Goldiibacteriota bacterium]
MTGKNPARRIKKGGFTLIEMLVVLAIIALLASLAGPAVFKKLGPAKRSIAEAQMKMFSEALDSYYIDTGRYPTAYEGLETLVSRPAGAKGWKGPYLRKQVPVDPWGSPYVYRTTGDGGFEIISFGADGIEGGEGENRDVYGR